MAADLQNAYEIPAAAAGAAAGSDAPVPKVVLCVDDEPNILSSLKRLFRPQGYRVHTAESGAQALELLEREHVDLIISDMRMPFMDGSQFLEQVCVKWPQTTRLLMTGYAEIGSAVAAINRGQIYHYVSKPWNDNELLLIVRRALERQGLEEERRRLEALTSRQNDELRSLNTRLEEKVEQRTAELSQAHDKLKKNYLTSIKAFSGLIEQRGSHLVGHARRVADVTRNFAQLLKLDEAMQRDLSIAALLHDIGQIGFPDAMLTKSIPRMTPDELKRYHLHPILGEQAFMGSDDLQTVASYIRSHHERFDGKGFPDKLTGDAIPLGAQILALAETYDDLQSGHIGSSTLTASEARTMMARVRGAQFDPVLLDAFLDMFPKTAPVHKHLNLTTAELQPGMMLAKDFMSDEGVVLLANDQVLTADLIERIRIFERRLERSLLLAVRHPG